MALDEGGIQARRRIRIDKEVIREASRRVCSLGWQAGVCPGLGGEGKNFPFLNKAIDNTTSTAVVISNKKKGKFGFPVSGSQRKIQNIPAPRISKLPAVKKLPAANQRAPELREVIANAICFHRF